MTTRYAVVQWIARISFGVAFIAGISLILGYAPLWAGVVLFLLIAALTAVILRYIDSD